ncbi:diacylglycerol/lipid kinase family protein [Nocardia transvalensis]|uniref:diacylglycerol/lipid kinase family protein n=1 Tax=Nocardia transvalensis TaxID=37333 RepID=UPI0018943F0F|nr:diacylglycerol kinase family protein [Nocardia transvalensis]MBF6330740.1 diacylglycerol kinase [Nocardia transvalensis]
MSEAAVSATITRTPARARVPVLAVVNPTAGGDPGAMVGALDEIDRVALRTVVTERAGDAERLVLEQLVREMPEVVVAVGGDGTAGQVAAALHAVHAHTGTSPALLLTPGGTGNSSFRGLWDHRSWSEVVQCALVSGRASTRTIDLALIEEFDALALLGCATGLLPAALVAARDLDGSGRDLLLRATAAAAATYEPYPGRVIVDDRVTIEGDILVADVGGMRHRGGDFQLLPHSLLDDGLIDVCVVTAAADLAELSRVALTAAIDELEGVHYARGRRIRLERRDGHNLLIEHDGELMPHTHTGYAIRVVPRAVRVLVPDPPPACLTTTTERGAR